MGGGRFGGLCVGGCEGVRWDGIGFWGVVGCGEIGWDEMGDRISGICDGIEDGNMECVFN